MKQYVCNIIFQRLPAVLSRIGVILASPLVRYLWKQNNNNKKQRIRNKNYIWIVIPLIFMIFLSHCFLIVSIVGIIFWSIKSTLIRIWTSIQIFQFRLTHWLLSIPLLSIIEAKTHVETMYICLSMLHIDTDKPIQTHWHTNHKCHRFTWFTSVHCLVFIVLNGLSLTLYMLSSCI